MPPGWIRPKSTSRSSSARSSAPTTSPISARSATAWPRSKPATTPSPDHSAGPSPAPTSTTCCTTSTPTKRPSPPPWQHEPYPRRTNGRDHLAGAAGVGRQAAHDLLQQFAVALLGLADGPGVLVHEAEPVGHGVYLRRKRVPHVLFQLLDAALKLLNRGHVGRIARPALNRALPRPTARLAGPFAARRERGSVCADGQAHEGDSLG